MQRHPVSRAQAALALAFLALPALAQQPAERPLRVVTTLPVLAELTRAVGGERVAVESLCDPRQDPHFVQPRPTLMQRVREADLLVEVGLQLELWAQKVADSSGNARVQIGAPGRVAAANGIATLEVPSVVSREYGDIHPYGNPHIWLDPLNAADMAANIAAALARVDPAHASDYAARSDALRARIDDALFGSELVAKAGGALLERLERHGRLGDYLARRGLAGELGGWLAKAAPLRGRPVVTYHKTWVYFATRFGFEVVSEIEEKPGIPPSARHRDQVLEGMRQRGVRTILQCLFYDRTAADYLAERTGASVVAAPIDVGADVGAADYFALIDRVLDGLLASETRP